MADLLNDYFKKIQSANQQRSMTGNQQYNQGVDASLAEGYFDSEQKNRLSQEQLDLQKQTQTGYLDIAKQNQAWNQNYQQQALDAQKSAQTTNLFGQAIGGASNLLMMNKFLNKMPNQQTSPTDQAVTGDVSGLGQQGQQVTDISGGFQPIAADQSLNLAAQTMPNDMSNLFAPAEQASFQGNLIDFDSFFGSFF
jgi:hypothetical protein